MKSPAQFTGITEKNLVTKISEIMRDNLQKAEQTSQRTLIEYKQLKSRLKENRQILKQYGENRFVYYLQQFGEELKGIEDFEDIDIIKQQHELLLNNIHNLEESITELGIELRNLTKITLLYEQIFQLQIYQLEDSSFEFVYSNSKGKSIAIQFNLDDSTEMNRNKFWKSFETINPYSR